LSSPAPYLAIGIVVLSALNLVWWGEAWLSSTTIGKWLVAWAFCQAQLLSELGPSMLAGLDDILALLLLSVPAYLALAIGLWALAEIWQWPRWMPVWRRSATAWLLLEIALLLVCLRLPV
jgi:hypothetical protein